MPTFNITKENVKRFKNPEYINGLAAEQNGTFTQDWIFDKSDYNNIVSAFIKQNSGGGLASNGINTPSSFEELRAIENNLNNDIIDEIDVVELDEIIDIDVIDDIELEFFYELDDTEEINMNEFSELLKKSGIQLEEENVKKLFISLDKNDNGQLDYAEVMRLVDYFSRKKIYTKKTEVSKESMTEKVSVNIDTRFRSEYYKTTSSEFDYEIPDVQKNVINMKIGSVEMPMASNTISSKLNNNTFLIISEANTRIEEYDICGSWRFHTQIGDISADYLYGTIEENITITVDETSGGRFSGRGFGDGHGQAYYSDLKYLTDENKSGIVPIKNVTFGKIDPPDASIDYPNVSNTSLEPLEALKTGRFTSLSDVTSDELSGNFKFPRHRSMPTFYTLPNHPFPLAQKYGNDQYSRIFTNTETPHPEDETVSHQYKKHQVPGKTEIFTKTEVADYTKTITTTSMYTRFYNFVKREWCENGTTGGTKWNGEDGVHSQYSNTASDAQFKGLKLTMYTEIEPLNLNIGKFVFMNAYSPRGNPRRTDICFNTLTYAGGHQVEYPYDCKRMNEKITDTKIKKQIHLKSLRYRSLQDDKENFDFNPVKYAWLATLPDGNYDEIINNNKGVEFERIVNDAICVAIPGAVDNVGNFCAIIDPDDYNYINNANNSNNNILTQNSIFIDEDANTHVTPGYGPELKYSMDSINNRSIFTTLRTSNNNNIVSRITKVNKFTVRQGQSSLRTVFDSITNGHKFGYLWNIRGYKDDQGNPHPPRHGEPYPEMMALLSKSREPKIVVTPITSTNPKQISHIKFNIDSYGNEDNDNIQHKLGWILGFRTGLYELAQNEDDKENIENIENTIDLAKEKSQRVQQSFFENTKTIAERLTPEAMELLSRANSLAIGNETDTLVANDSQAKILYDDICAYAKRVYTQAKNIYDAVRENTNSPSSPSILERLNTFFVLENDGYYNTGVVLQNGYYNTGGEYTDGQTNEYFAIIHVANTAMRLLFEDGINSTDDMNITEMHDEIIETAKNITKGDLLEFAELVVEMAKYEIAMYANYEIIKEAYDKIIAMSGNQNPTDIPDEKDNDGNFKFNQSYHAIVTLPYNELEFAKKAADAAYLWLHNISLNNVGSMHTANLSIYPARDNRNQEYKGMTPYDYWATGNSYPGNEYQNYPWYLDVHPQVTNANGVKEDHIIPALPLSGTLANQRKYVEYVRNDEFANSLINIS